MKKKTITKEKALERLASLCSRSEQCEFDLIRKLTAWGISSSDRKDIIEYLKENRYVDDSRFAKSFANDKARFSSWGPFKIKSELSLRKIKSSFILEAIESIDREIWKEALLKNAASKSKALDLIGEEGLENSVKLFRYLANRGFSSEWSRKAVELMKKRQRKVE